MRIEPRKNWKGFTPHIFKLLEEVIVEDFPSIAEKIRVRKFICGEKGIKVKENFNILISERGPFPNERTLAHVSFKEMEDDRYFNAIGYSKENTIRIHLVLQESWLEKDDEEIKDVFRHELLHIELKKKDNDIEFIEEAIRRGITLNNASYSVLYTKRTERNGGHFNLKLFNFCFPEGFEYWSQFLNPWLKGYQP